MAYFVLMCREESTHLLVFTLRANNSKITSF